MSALAEFQTGLGRALRGEGHSPVDAQSPGFRLTAKVRRSWCEGRAAMAGRMVLLLLPVAQRRALVDDYVDQGGGQAAFASAEAETFLAFLAPRLDDPSHALSVCRMEQAAAAARGGEEHWSPPAAPAGSSARLRHGRHAAIVWFHADPANVLMALKGAPPPPVGPPSHPVLFAPGIPNLFRPAEREEVRLWQLMPSVVSLSRTARLIAEGVLELATSGPVPGAR